MVEVMLVRYVNINARCRASGVLVPLACAVGGTNTYTHHTSLPIKLATLIGHGRETTAC